MGTDADSQKALDWLLRASMPGDGESTFYAAYIYDKGIGLERDSEKAEYLYKRAVFQLSQTDHYDSSAVSLYLLGLMYRYGMGKRLIGNYQTHI